MRSIILSLCIAISAAVASADTTVIVNGRGRVAVVSAQDHADYLAATHTFSHCGRRGGGYEGLGFSTVSPSAAVRRACYWGQRKAREIATAWCPLRRGWVAVVRYE